MFSLTRTDRPTGRALAILATLSLVTGMLTAVAAGASPVVDTCWAMNVSAGTPADSNLQRVINAASSGDTIEVKNVCIGNFHIGKALTVVGATTPEVSRPVLTADGVGRVLRVGAAVTLTNVMITGGHAREAAGILNSGTLSLSNTVVAGNTAGFEAGGIWNRGTLTLNGSSSVRGNTAGYYGGGIENAVFNGSSTLTLNDSTSVRGNRAIVGGGGVANGRDALFVMNDASFVSGNGARRGGGIFNNSTLIMNDQSLVTENTARRGGGIYYFGPITLKGSSSVVGNRAASGDGGISSNGTISACNGKGVDEWTGAISPNEPNHPPVVDLIACA